MSGYMEKRETNMKNIIPRKQAAGAVAFCAILVLALAAEGIADLVAPFPNSEGDKPVAVEAVSTPAPSPVPTPEPTPDYSYIPLDAGLAGILVESCQREDVPLELALAVIERESGFDVEAVGVDGHDVGLFQIRDSNHEWLASETGADPLEPEGNIVCGVWFLAYLHDYCGGDWEAALTCWRWGPGHGETSEYARAVLAAAERG